MKSHRAFSLLPLTYIAVSWLAHSIRAQQPDSTASAVRMDIFRQDAAALEGYYGDPHLHTPSSLRSMEWHPSGRVVGHHPLAETSNSNFMNLGLWLPDTKQPRLVNRGILNVGWPFAMSSNGEWFCAMTERSVDNPSIDPVLGAKPGALSCFRWADRTRVWMMPYDPQETVVDTCVVNRDTQLVILVQRSAQSLLKLLNLADGKEVRRLPLPGGGGISEWPARRRLAVLGTSLAIVREINGPERLLLLRLDTWTTETVTTPHIEENAGNSLAASADGRWLAVSSAESYALIRCDQGKYEQVVSGTMVDPYVGSEIRVATFSPDSRFFFVGSTGSAKLIELANLREVQTLTLKCLGASFAPDGRSMAIATPDHGFRLWALKGSTLVEPAYQSQQNQGPVTTLRYIHGGSGLLAGDERGFTLWDVPTRRPSHRLAGNQVPTREYAFSSTALVDNGKTLLSGDGYSFQRWSLPPAPQPVSVSALSVPEIKSVSAFSGVRTRREPELMQLGASQDGRWLLQIESRRVTLRDLQKPELVQSVIVPPVMSYDGVKIFDHAGRGSLLMRAPAGGLGWVEIPYGATAGRELKSTDGRSSRSLLFLPRRMAALEVVNNRVVVLEEASGKVLTALSMPHDEIPKIGGGGPAVASPDEKLAAGFYHFSTDRLRSCLALWDLHTGRNLALQILPPGRHEVLAFSPDGQKLACAQSNGVTSEWSIAKLLTTAPPEVAIERFKPRSALPPAVLQKRPVATASPATAGQTAATDAVLTELPATPVVDRVGDAWTLSKGGVLAAGDRLPLAGRLLVDDQVFQDEGARVFKTSARDHSREIAGWEGQAMGGRLWVSRHVGRPVACQSNELLFADTLTNTGSNPLTATVAFEVQFPADSNGIMDSQFKTVSIADGGTVAIGPEVQWVAPSQSGKPGDLLPLFYFNNETAEQPPSLKWDEQHKVLRASYEIKLSPWERRHLMHGIVMQKRDPQALLDVFAPVARQDLGSLVLPVVARAGINFGRAKNPHTDPQTGQWTEWAYDPSDKDMAGFRWTAVPGMSMQGEMGGLSVLSLNVNGKPLGFTGKSLIPRPGLVESQVLITQGPDRGMMRGFSHPVTTPEILTGYTPNSQVAVTRQVPAMISTITLLKDSILNLTDHDQDIVVSYTSVFKAPPVAFLDILGNPVDGGQKELRASTLGGGCVVVMNGEQKPATVLKFFQEGARLEPRLHWIAERVLSIEYALHLGPRESCRLSHQAGQRMLGAFPNLTQALGGFTAKMMVNSDNPTLTPVNMQ